MDPVLWAAKNGKVGRATALFCGPKWPWLPPAAFAGSGHGLRCRKQHRIITFLP
jgi:hypothetical protein